MQPLYAIQGRAYYLNTERTFTHGRRPRSVLLEKRLPQFPKSPRSPRSVPLEKRIPQVRTTLQIIFIFPRSPRSVLLEKRLPGIHSSKRHPYRAVRRYLPALL